MKKLPKISALMRESWEVLKPSAMQLLKLYFVCALIGIVIFAIFGSIGFFGGVSGILGVLGTKPTVEAILKNINIPIIVFSGLGLFVSIWILTLASTISMVDIIAKKGALSAIDALKGAMDRVGPLFITSFLSSILILGSTVLFVLPGIFMGVMLAFAQLDLILGRQTPTNAIKRSARLVMDNFGQLFLHWGALVLLYIVVQVIIPNSLNNAVEQLQGIVGLLSSITNVVLSWFFISYNILLYKKLSGKETKKESMVWMWAMAGLGWVVFFLLMSSIVRFVTSPVFMNAITDGLRKNQNMRNEQYLQQYQKQYQKEINSLDSSKDSTTYSY